jgi:acyl-CoA synthetase (AMP-forming)/AMP-acid ligase II
MEEQARRCMGVRGRTMTVTVQDRLSVGDPLTGWLGSPESTTGFHCLDRSWRWTFASYELLAAETLSNADALRAARLGPGARIGVVATQGAGFAAWLFAILLCRGTCVVLPPRSTIEGRELYRARLDVLIGAASAEAVVDPRDGSLSRTNVGAQQFTGRDERYSPDGDDAVALVQFSSGTTGTPKVLDITRSSLVAAIRAIARWLEISSSDSTASWLPSFHDMGLIGTLLTPVLSQTGLYQLEPSQFLRRPAEWLRCFGEHGCTMTSAPTFGYEHAAAYVEDDELSGLDLSGWRVAIVGAEPVRSEALGAFMDKFGKHGFRDEAWCPAYGLAEATLVVTGTRPGVGLRHLADGLQCDPGGSVEVTGGWRHSLVASGSPLPGFQVEIRSPEGEVLPEGHIGEICVSGPTLARQVPWSRSGDRWLPTGDLGSLSDGHLYVWGRAANTAKIRGRTVLLEDVEAQLQQMLGTRSVVVIMPGPARFDGFAIVIEACDRTTETRALAAKPRISALLSGAEIKLMFLRRRTLPRTTSGKVKRMECWSRLVASSDGDEA